MAYLIDTTNLGRLANLRDVQYPVAAGAALELHRRGEVLHVNRQILIELIDSEQLFCTPGGKSPLM
jgi:hypothetical protein